MMVWFSKVNMLSLKLKLFSPQLTLLLLNSIFSEIKFKEAGMSTGFSTFVIGPPLTYIVSVPHISNWKILLTLI
jgi:hypothetical protein